jgi:transcriptional regulator with XRE-family HTH domain
VRNTEAVDRRTELGEFLRSRRAALKPADVGLPEFGRRRVPGLRREELSLLAGVSLEHYTRIEQGRGVRPSAQVLDAIATALALTDAERAHLHDLAAPAPPSRRRPRPQPRVRPGLQRLLGQMHEHPAFVLGPRMDVLAWNGLAAQVFGDFSRFAPERRNMAWLVFLDDETAALYPDWETVARETVAFLRAGSARDLEDPRLAELVGELSLKSDAFRRWWAARDVKDKASGTKRLRHPVVGELELSYETFIPAGQPEQALVVYSAQEGTPSYTALRLLQTLAAEPAAAVIPTPNPAT